MITLLINTFGDFVRKIPRPWLPQSGLTMYVLFFFCLLNARNSPWLKKSTKSRIIRLFAFIDSIVVHFSAKDKESLMTRRSSSMAKGCNARLGAVGRSSRPQSGHTKGFLNYTWYFFAEKIQHLVKEHGSKNPVLPNG